MCVFYGIFAQNLPKPFINISKAAKALSHVENFSVREDSRQVKDAPEPEITSRKRAKRGRPPKVKKLIILYRADEARAALRGNHAGNLAMGTVIWRNLARPTSDMRASITGEQFYQVTYNANN